MGLYRDLEKFRSLPFYIGIFIFSSYFFHIPSYFFIFPWCFLHTSSYSFICPEALEHRKILSFFIVRGTAEEDEHVALIGFDNYRAGAFYFPLVVFHGFLGGGVHERYAIRVEVLCDWSMKFLAGSNRSSEITHDVKKYALMGSRR